MCSSMFVDETSRFVIHVKVTKTLSNQSCSCRVCTVPFRGSEINFLRRPITSITSRDYLARSSWSQIARRLRQLHGGRLVGAASLLDVTAGSLGRSAVNP